MVQYKCCGDSLVDLSRTNFVFDELGHVTELVKDEVSHAEVDKGVSAALILDHTPSQGMISQDEGGTWTRTPPGAGMTAK